MNKKRLAKTLGRAGGIDIAVGVIMILTGITTGVLSIVSGARVLKCKADL